MNFKVLTKSLGGLLTIFSIVFLIPALHAIYSSSNTLYNFLIPFMITIISGTALLILSKNVKQEMNHRTGFAVVSASWILVSFLGALPYYYSAIFPTFTDCFFESISGFSGTGASVLTDIEAQDKSLLLWRSMTQWLGGLGIVVFFIAILPILGAGGVQLFRAEATGPNKDKITPRLKDTARTLWKLYVGLTIFLSFLLYFLGMNLFDAINHAMTTISTGGFSTRNTGINYFESSQIEYIIAFFMIISSISFSLYYRLIDRKNKNDLYDTELKAYIGIVLFSVLILTFINFGNVYENLEVSFRKTLFTIAATASSTGFTNADYLPWPIFSHFIIILLMTMGGMSGSTAGGMKCVRTIAAFKLLKKELHQAIHPHGALNVSLNQKAIRPQIASAIWGFLFIYLLTFSIIAAILTLEGVDLVTAGTAAISALSNIGPAFGSLGPFDNYAALSELSKISLSLGMIVGRLEFFTIIVLFTREFWRK